MPNRILCACLVIASAYVPTACGDGGGGGQLIVCGECELECDVGPEGPVDAADVEEEVDLSDAALDVEEETEVPDGAGDVEAVDIPTDPGTQDGPADIPEETADGADAGEVGPLTCMSCHGSGSIPAPPLDTQGRDDTSLLTVGAHRSHLRTSLLYRTVMCRDCHIVPGNIEEVQHIDEPPAELTWGPIPQAAGVVPELREDSTCRVYCHGVTLSGGAVTEPSWTIVNGSQVFCGSCHGLPPTEEHPQVSVDSCESCHPFFGGPDNHELHVNGILELSEESP